MLTAFKISLAVLFCVLVSVMVLLFGPRQKVNWREVKPFDFDVSEIDAYLRQSESQFDDIKKNQQKQVIWANKAGVQTDVALVYLHGFSASLGEIRPVPDEVAAALGANLYFTRLAGHGRSGEAMAEASLMDWINDLAEAMAIGRAIGKKVVVIGTSNGGALASMIVEQESLRKHVAALVFISPNFAVKNKIANLARLAYFDKWGPIIGGEWREWPPRNSLHAQYWTTGYPTKSIVPMMRLLAHVEKIDFTHADIPALFYFSENDQVSDQSVTAQIAKEWGAKTLVTHPQLTEEDDPDQHVIAGDTLSPNQNDAAKGAILDFLTEVF